VQILIPFLFLTMILALLCSAIQNALRSLLASRPVLLFLAPAILSGLFCGVAAALGALTLPLTALILAYGFVPTACAWLIRDRPAPAWADFGIILLLWLPLELSVGGPFVPRPLQGLLHLAAYGVSITLGLTLFLLFRRLDGMKYQFPGTRRDFVKPDFVNPLIGFAALAPVLMALGRALGFLVPMHMPAHRTPLGFAGQFLAILAATALPEEILFRGLIQNSLMQKLGAKEATLLLASLIFGCAHLNNGPGPLPNWRYMILATIAGYAYGKVFEKGSSIFASAFLHALVDSVKHWFF
jgi:membrane protease YdiL (CAAX protease family)